MTFNLAEVPARLDDIAAKYEREGFILLTGVEDQIAARFRAMLARTIGVGEEQFGEMIAPATSAPVFDREIRRRLARVPTSEELTANLLEALGPLLGRLLGPLVHISSTYHAQFKGGLAREVRRGGYAADSDYMEVHGPYLLHQDFAGATIPTSPSALTVWVAVNSCPDWNLRVYPGSHRAAEAIHQNVACKLEYRRQPDMRLAAPWRNWPRQAPVTEVHEASAN